MIQFLYLIACIIIGAYANRLAGGGPAPFPITGMHKIVAALLITAVLLATTGEMIALLAGPFYLIWRLGEGVGGWKDAGSMKFDKESRMIDGFLSLFPLTQGGVLYDAYGLFLRYALFSLPFFALSAGWDCWIPAIILGAQASLLNTLYRHATDFGDPWAMEELTTGGFLIALFLLI